MGIAASLCGALLDKLVFFPSHAATPAGSGAGLRLVTCTHVVARVVLSAVLNEISCALYPCRIASLHAQASFLSLYFLPCTDLLIVSHFFA